MLLQWKSFLLFFDLLIGMSQKSYTNIRPLVIRSAPISWTQPSARAILCRYLTPEYTIEPLHHTRTSDVLWIFKLYVQQRYRILRSRCIIEFLFHNIVSMGQTRDSCTASVEVEPEEQVQLNSPEVLVPVTGEPTQHYTRPTIFGGKYELLLRWSIAVHELLSSGVSELLSLVVMLQGY